MMPVFAGPGVLPPAANSMLIQAAKVKKVDIEMPFGETVIAFLPFYAKMIAEMRLNRAWHNFSGTKIYMGPESIRSTVESEREPCR
jgi:hypothetical protein